MIEPAPSMLTRYPAPIDHGDDQVRSAAARETFSAPEPVSHFDSIEKSDSSEDFSDVWSDTDPLGGASGEPDLPAPAPDVRMYLPGGLLSEELMDLLETPPTPRLSSPAGDRDRISGTSPTGGLLLGEQEFRAHSILLMVGGL
ncbi:MAG UNVERIFIED_CONTAM: hypothetical protein LVR18_22805 [Planctomycetaceae bacterium]|jgi:hypothetical protein